jgi:hypothetical protein
MSTSTRKLRSFHLAPRNELATRFSVHEGALLALFGLALRLAASLLIAELITGMLCDVVPTDVATLGLVALMLILVTLLASAISAWRASEIGGASSSGGISP